MTIFFHAFVLMQVFNSVSARKLENGTLNPFSNLCNNSLYWVIQGFTLAVQFLLVQFGGGYVQVVPLTVIQHGLCLGVGMFGILVGMLVKLMPERLCSKIELFNNIEIREE